jgi:hypothetical protein
VINAGTQLQFDVEVKASATGTFHRDLQIYFDYNTAAFGSNIATGAISYTPLTLMENHYSVVNDIVDNTSSKVAIITEADNEGPPGGLPGSSTDFNEITTTYQGLLRFTIDILPGMNTETCGIAFDQDLMNGGQYYQSTDPVPPDPYPIKYADLCVYEGDISTLKLSSLYGTIAYWVPAGIPIHDCTVTLKQGATTVGTATTDVNGNYYLSGFDDGFYTIETSCSLAPGGATSQDLGLINDYLLLVPGATLSDLQKLAGDLNWSGPGQVTSQDLGILNDVLLLVNPPYTGDWTAPHWVFEVQSASIVSGMGNVDFEGLCTGDVNGSYDTF